MMTSADSESTAAHDAGERIGDWPQRIAIIGAAGTVGSSGIGQELFLVDVRKNLVAGHAIDIADAQTLTGVPSPRITPGTPQDGPVDVVVVAASKPEVPHGDRRDFLSANAALLGTLLPQIESLAGDHGLVLLLSNPVDILAGWLARESSLPRHRILGYSLNDSARFRSAVARELGVGVDRVQGMVLGEHGNGQVPLYSGVRLDGEPLALDPDQRRRVDADVHGWFHRWSELETGRSSGWATGAGVRHLLEELAAGRPVVTTASGTGLEDYPEAFIALPARRSGGRVQALSPETDPQETRDLLEAARRVRDEVDALGSAGLQGRG